MQVLFVVHRAHSNLNQTSNLRIYMFFQEFDTSMSQLFNWHDFFLNLRKYTIVEFIVYLNLIIFYFYVVSCKIARNGNSYSFKFLSHWNMIISWVSHNKLENFYIKVISFFYWFALQRWRNIHLLVNYLSNSVNHISLSSTSN